MVARVKNYKAGFVVSDSNIKPDDTLADVVELSAKTGHSTIAVTDDGTANGKLLVIKDSYANCILPFLAEHYAEITVVDPRYCSHSQIKDICVENFDAVITLFNVSGFSQEQNFSLIEFMGGK